MFSPPNPNPIPFANPFSDGLFPAAPNPGKPSGASKLAFAPVPSL